MSQRSGMSPEAKCADADREPSRECLRPSGNRGPSNEDAVMIPVKKLMSWWRGPTDPETLAREAEAQRELADRQTIRISQNMTAKGTSDSLLSAPTPDVLHPGREDSHKSR
jgi:hypothetical protein